MKHPALDDLITDLNALRKMLDETDRTPFGDMSLLLDKMTAHCDRALRAAHGLEDA